MIILADVHLREESAETVLQYVLPGAGVAAVEEGSRELAILGDVLTFRYKIDARLQNMLIDALRSITAAGVTVRIIPGNHDQYEVGGRNALEPLDEMKGVSVYTEPQVDKDGYWLPYRKRIEDIAASIEPLTLAPTTPRVLFAHHGVRGAWMNDNIQDNEGLPLDAFKQFHTVLLGHYHRRQSIGNCHYIGSPYQTKADEAGQEKGYAVWDGRQLTYVTTDWGKRYHMLKVGPSGVLAIDSSVVRPGDEVRVSTAAGVDPQTVVDQLQKSGVENHIVTPDVEVTQARLDVPENAGLRAYAQAYVDAQETPLDKSRLMQTFQELTE